MKDKTADLDVRGLSCPEPLLLTKKMMETGAWRTLTILADSIVPAENIKRLAKSSGYGYNVERIDDEFLITLSK